MNIHIYIYIRTLLIYINNMYVCIHVKSRVVLNVKSQYMLVNLLRGQQSAGWLIIQPEQPVQSNSA